MGLLCVNHETGRSVGPSPSPLYTPITDVHLRRLALAALRYVGRLTPGSATHWKTPGIAGHVGYAPRDTQVHRAALVDDSLSTTRRVASRRPRRRKIMRHV